MPDDIDELSPLYPDQVIVTLTSGKILKASCAKVPGGQDEPLTQRRLIEKVHDCVAYAGDRKINSEDILDAPANTPFSEIVALLNFDTQST